MIADEKEKALDSARALKVALVSHDPAAYLEHFFGGSPVPESKTRIATPIEPDFDPAETGATEGEWQFTENMDPNEAERIMAELLADPTGVMTAPDLGEWR